MSVDRSVPTPPPTVTGQSPKEEVVVVSVEKIADVIFVGSTIDRAQCRRIAELIVVESLPVIERDLRADERERCIAVIEDLRLTEPPESWPLYEAAAARVREGVRHA